ncbi:SDR family NAD(P)-dependent oxidoreductase [Dactylosporangium matsuzakiense]|uniref:Ketoreductase n=1 Tax=Dactylosporangium matsuzakiense TaxID=53360 RepID=A0A9W6KKP5_9ACTN|nr:SDR family oxidoreductase [Dactylosporangium matsuzakiense]UWZ45892.1 SDR family oxidoreductase [Dactylosporangium matsuzakiense]GLL02943.1 ketoreductase [Dactylosporangium matsuzakiense]
MSQPVRAEPPRPAPQRPAVVVTGGGTGIGRATAHLFAKEGADVLVVGRQAGPLEETADGHPAVRTFVQDITVPGGAAAVVAAALDAFGRIDVLVNNAGIIRPAMLGEVDWDRAHRQIATNLIAPLFLAQEAFPHMRPGAVIVNVTSNPAGKGWPGNCVYGSTKVALDFFTNTWAVELGGRGIRVVSVAPGVTDTPVLVHADLPAEERAARRRRYNARVPLGRTAQPEEIAWWIVQATRPEASYLTGSVLRVDGGIGVC